MQRRSGGPIRSATAGGGVPLRVDLFAGDLLDKIDDGSPQLCVRNLREGFRKPEPVGRGEIWRLTWKNVR